ncbi:MAG: hypothetical protein KJS64_06535 [Acidobacteria bacterium]|nr:hypothetical protein [Acidobacteriota bacterium]
MPLIDPRGIGDALASGIFDWLTGGVAPMLSLLGGLLTSTGSTNHIVEQAGAFISRFELVIPMITLVGVALGVLQSLGSGSIRRVAIFTVIGVLTACLTLPTSRIVLVTCDAIASLVTPGTGQRIRSVSASLGLAGLSPTSSVIGALCLVAGLILCCELLMRSLILVLLICVIPLTAAAMAWAPARQVTLRCVETFAGVAAAKFVVEFTLAIGLSMLERDPGASALLLAATTLTVAGFMPLVILRLFPVSLGGAAHHFDGVRQRLSRAPFAVAQHPGVSMASSLLPSPPAPPPPTQREDLGLEMWPSSGSSSLPPRTFPPPRIPVVPSRLPRRPVIGFDEMGPRIEWEWDDE